MSKVFFETYHTSERNKFKILCSGWHGGYPFYAVSTANGVVTMYNEDGERVEECNLSRSSPCTALAWHPVQNMLFTGWKDGVVIVYDDSRGQHMTKEIPNSVHNAAINRMKWNDEGTRLITADEKRNVGIWAFDQNNMKLALLARCTCPEQVEHVEFRRSIRGTAKPEGATPGATMNDQWSYFFAGDRGTIFSADDTGNVTKLIETGATGLAALIFDENKCNLVYLTKTSFLHTYAVREDLTVEKLQSVKISTASAASGIKGQSKIRAIYIGNGVLATCSNERFVRIWNLNSDENFVLSDPNRRIIHPIEDIAFNPRKRAIVGITSERHLIIWQYTGDSMSLERHELQVTIDAEETEDVNETQGGTGGSIQNIQQARNSLQDWEYYADWKVEVPTSGSEPKAAGTGDDEDLVCIEWGPGENILSVYSTNDVVVSILHETVFQRTMRQGLAVIQTSRDTLLIERQIAFGGGNEGDAFELQGGTLTRSRRHQPATIRCGIKIKQVSCTKDHIAISSGQRIEIWEVRDGMMRSKSSIDVAARCIALHGEGVFVVPLRISVTKNKTGQHDSRNSSGGTESFNRIEVYSFSGVRKQTIPIAEDEGPVVDIDIQGDYIAIGTQNNFVQLWQMTGREAKQASASRRVFSREYRELQKWIHAQNLDRRRRGIKSPLTMESVNTRQIASVRVNCNGTKISVLSRLVRAKSIREPGTVLLVYDLEQGKEYIYDFRAASRFPLDHYWDDCEPRLFGLVAQKFSTARIAASPTPVPKAKGRASDAAMRAAAMAQQQEKYSVCTLFATPDHGIQLQDSFPLNHSIYVGLIGVSVPFLYFLKKDDAAITAGTAEPAERADVSLMDRQYMRDFQGIDDGLTTDSRTRRSIREALLNFSYNLTIGNMEEAYKSVKAIKDPSVWSNMARMCVKTKKLEVAEICLGNMQDARASMALRETKDIPEIEARIAMLAIQLGLTDEAERLYMSCKRYDLLNKMYQSMGHWDKALDVAKSHDRIHLRTTHYHYARHLESMGDFIGAIRHYEASKTHAYEVPRMLYENEQHLERYIRATVAKYQNYLQNGTHDSGVHMDTGSQTKIATIEEHEREQFLSNCKALMKWWAQYNEGIGNYENSFEFYRLAEDHCSLVRMYCFIGKLKEAASIVIQSGDRAAAYMMAVELEKTNQVKPAIEFYVMAQSFKNAIRLARQNDMAQEVMNLALQAPPPLMLDAAHYFEEKGQMERAVTLFQKSGHVARAIDICFRAELFDKLLEIAESVSSQLERQAQDGNTDEHGQEVAPIDPEILIRCGDFFMDHGEYEKAVMMYINAKEYGFVLELCVQKGVILTEEMAERILPSHKIRILRQRYNEETPEQREVRSLLHRIASIAAQQGQYDLAAKKFVQLGDKETAMKVLIKSGNTEKIKFFATMSRSAGLYVLAANYLQNLDWHSRPEIMKSIIDFYTRAKAWQRLARFFEACSQVEIDDYRNYDKALDALKEALKYMNRAASSVKDGSSHAAQVLREQLMQLKNRIYLVDKFIMARSLTKSDPDEMIKLCDQMLNEIENNNQHGIEESVRMGDVYALLVEFFYSQGEMQLAYDRIMQMRDKQIPLNYYLDPPIVTDICNQLGVGMIPMGDEHDDDDDGDGDIVHDDMDSDDGDGVEPFVEEDLSD